MEIIIQKSQKAASVIAADSVSELIQKNPDAVIGLSSGDSPRLLYQELVRREQSGELDLSRVSCFALDEYLGLGPENQESYAHYYEKNLFSLLRRRPKNIRLLNGLCKDVGEECCRYEGEIEKAGGIDLQILGIGRDGHIAFNEPGSSLASRTRIKTLTPTTLRQNRKHFAGKSQPQHAITMGVGTILDARRCLLLAFGAGKAGIVRSFVEGPITASVPASALQLHPLVHVYLDSAASAKLKRHSYYQYVFENKPKN